MQVVATRRLAHQTHFRQHGAAAAVGAAGDPEDDGVIRRAVLGQQPLDVGDEGRQHALGLGHCQGQVGRATQAMDCLRCSLTPSSSRPYWRASASMRAFSPAGTPAMMRFWLAVEAEVPLMHLGDLQHAGLEGLAGKSSRRPFSINRVRWCLPSIPSHPAEAIATAGEFIKGEPARTGCRRGSPPRP